MIELSVVAIEAVFGTNPEVTLLIFEQGIDLVVTQRGAILCLVLIGGKTIAIVAVEAVVSTNPEVAPAIFKDAVDCILRKPMLYIEVIEMIGLRPTEQCQTATKPDE